MSDEENNLPVGTGADVDQAEWIRQKEADRNRMIEAFNKIREMLKKKEQGDDPNIFNKKPPEA